MPETPDNRTASPVDYSLDRIGDRLDHPEREPILAKDDAVRARWILDRVPPNARVCEVGASDGGITKRLLQRDAAVWAIERHAAHRAKLALLSSVLPCWIMCGEADVALRTMPDGFFDIVLVCEVLEHMSGTAAFALFELARRKARMAIVTVPNMNAKSFERAKRQRYDWPDHKSHWDAYGLSKLTKSAVEPIVGESRNDSIWLGSVAGR